MKDREALTRTDMPLEEFAFTLAHDLREPLRTITALTELLARGVKTEAKKDEIARLTLDAASRMSGLIDNFLLLASTGQSEQPEDVDLHEVLDAALQNLRLSIEENGAVVTSGPLPFVNGHKGHLIRVFQNLISNAMKYRNAEPPEIRVSAEQRGADWDVEVTDKGIGIDPEDHDRIFRLFTRLHGHNIVGAGIGLAFCRKVVEDAGGRIWVESQLGAGATFHFTVAAAAPRSNAACLCAAAGAGA